MQPAAAMPFPTTSMSCAKHCAKRRPSPSDRRARVMRGALGRVDLKDLEARVTHGLRSRAGRDDLDARGAGPVAGGEDRTLHQRRQPILSSPVAADGALRAAGLHCPFPMEQAVARVPLQQAWAQWGLALLIPVLAALVLASIPIYQMRDDLRAEGARVSQRTAFFHLGKMVEYGKTTDIFTNPREERTKDYITGRYG